jgi:2-oxoglutarate dehydrogenase E1 component
MSTLRASPASVNAWSAEYLDAQYQAFKADPASTPPDLAAFFAGFDLGLSRPAPAAGSAGAGAGVGGGAGSGDIPVSGEVLRFHLGVTGLVRAYRALGHLGAKIDPFGRERARPPEISLRYHGLSEGDLSRSVREVNIVAQSRALPASTLGDLVAALERLYCGAIGVEFMHIADTQRRHWMQEQYEATLRQPDGSPLVQLWAARLRGP